MPDYVLPATTQLEHTGRAHELRPHLRAAQRGGRRPARRSEAEHDADLPRARRHAWASTTPASPDARRGARPRRDAAGAPRRRRLRRPAHARLGQARHRRERPFADGNFPSPSGKCLIDSPGYGVPDYVANYESAGSAPELAARFPLAMISPPARNFLNSTFVNVTSLRGLEGEPVLELSPGDAAARGIPFGRARARLQRSRQPRMQSGRGRSGTAGGSSTAWACGGAS